MQKRRRIKHEKSFEQRLAEEAQRFREAAEVLPPGMARELLMKRVRMAEAAAHMNQWLKSPSLQRSKGCAVGWLAMHESGTFVTFTPEGAELFA